MIPVKKTGRATLIWRAVREALGRPMYEMTLVKKHNPEVKLYVIAFSREQVISKASWYIAHRGYKIVEGKQK